jgi:hypothetical protein
MLTCYQSQANFGSSRVGNGAFALAAVPSLLPGKLGRNFRVAHLGVLTAVPLRGDPVPTVPPRSLQLNGNYAHIIPGLALTQTDPLAQANAGEVTDVLTDADIDTATFFSFAQNNGTDFHNNYFGPIAKCGISSVFLEVFANFDEFKEIVNNLTMTFPNPLFEAVNGVLQSITIPTEANLRIPLAIVA